MVHLFKLAGYDFGIAHCNFNLRAEESQRDEHFVSMLADSLGIPFFVKHFDTKKYSKEHKVSIQMAARDLRYQWFEELREKEGYDVIALAQHQDDAIETILLNLTRGTGIAGLHGILPKRGNLIRPLLFLSRTQINQLIENNNLSFVEDSSNGSDKYARNKLRLKVIPRLKEINPNLELTFQHNIQRFADTELVLQKAVTDLRTEIFVTERDAIHLSINKVKAIVPQKLLLFELLKPYDFTESVVEELLQSLDKQSGTSFSSSTHQIILNREDLILTVIGAEHPAHRLLIHGDEEMVVLDGQQISIATCSRAALGQDLKFEGPHKAYLDTEKLIYPLVWRTRQEGDRFKPLGMDRFKKLSDYFIDEKIPVTRKDQIPVIVNGNGEIIWIAGQRQDNRYKIIPSTKNVTLMEWRDLHITFPKQS